VRYILINNVIPPAGKLTRLNDRITAVNQLSNVLEKKAYIKKTNTWGLLKKWLSEFSGGKCWYCEAITERAVCDVDHFRPKAGVTVNRKPVLGHDGYYWLAYDWKNYRFSCQRCNRPEKDEHKIQRGKANEFGLIDEAQRNKTSSSALVEQPLLLDPCIDNDTKLLAHLVDGTVMPAVEKPSIEYDRAKYTIDVLGFNSFGVAKKKQHQWQTLNLLIEMTGLNESPQITDRLKEYTNSNAEYSRFFIAAIGTHRDKPWVEAIL